MVIAIRRVGSRDWIVGLLWGAFVYGIHKYGAIAGWYFEFSWFQNVTHAASASGVAVLLTLVGTAAGYRRGRLVLVVVVATALCAVGWEVVEYFGLLDQYGVYLYFHDLNDAAVDMVANTVGVTVTLSVLWWSRGMDLAIDPE